MTAADRPPVTDNARDEEPLAWCPGCGDRIPTEVVRERGVCSNCYGTSDDPWAAGRAETTTEEWPRCKASRDGGCDRCHDEHGRHIPCRAETTTDAIEDAALTIRYATLNDGTVELDEVVASNATGLYPPGLVTSRPLATARTRPTREQVIDVLREKDPDNHNGWHSPADHYYEAQADAVLALLADQPTEAEAGARALEQAAEAVYTDSVPSLAPWLLTRAARIRAGGA